MIRHTASIHRHATKLLLSVVALVLILVPGALRANQTPAVASRITQPIDESNLVTLKGNRHPLAQARYDQGAAADSQPMNRILVMLQRSPAQETALRQLLDAQKSASSPNFHQWLTPAEFGQQFGPSDSDIAAVTSWLQSHGFTINRVSAGRTVIEISGNAGQIRSAFHTEIHQYLVNGKSHFANNSDPQIPAALAPVFAGFVSLNNFPKKALHRVVGQFPAPKNTGGQIKPEKPLVTFTSNGTTYYGVGPYDFATIYNSLPLWNLATPIDGTGQTIAIVGDSNINCRDVTSFRNSFGLPMSAAQLAGDCSQTSSNVQVILDGPDPGITGDEIEADLDVEWSGAVAKGAHIDFVASADTATSAGIDLSAEYIVDNNLAGQMSESFGECEQNLGLGVGFYEAIWEQASAQGITVVISSGDSGAAGCDDDNSESEAVDGPAVNGIGSTPFNVAAGGTDFNDATTQPLYWNPPANTATQETAKGYIPEIPWNDSCAASGIAACTGISLTSPLLNIVGGGGGASACTFLTQLFAQNGFSGASAPNCLKPGWQSGIAGTTGDLVRDLPDISLFAAAGSDSNSFYLICESDQDPLNQACDSPGGGFIGVGGTSSAAPAFAGIMAMVNQYMAAHGKPSPQGNANYELYSLATIQSMTPPTGGCNSTSAPNNANGTGCTFYDITQGNNSVPCAGGTTNCSNTSGASGAVGALVLFNNTTPSTTLTWQAAAGYDLATGLGSVNVNNLVTNWPTAVGKFVATTSTLLLCTTTSTTGCSSTSITITHGQKVFVNATVSLSPGPGNPPAWSFAKPEDVALIGTPNTLSNNPGNSTTAAVDRFSAAGGNTDDYTLGSGGSTVNEYTYYLVGGTYNVVARYTGDGTNGGSSSPAVSVTVNPENSTTQFNMVSVSSGSIITSAPYGSALEARVDVLGTTNIPVPGTTTSQPEETATGNVNLSDSATGTNFPSGTYTLNTEGSLEVQPGLNQIPALSVGTHTFQASYLGDASYNPSSTAGTSAFTVTKAPTAMTLTSNATSVPTGTSVTLTAIVATNSFGNNPTGTVSFTAGGTALPGTVQYSNYQDPNNGWAELQATLAYTVNATTTISASYAGDANYTAAPTAATLTLTAAATTGVTVAITNKMASVAAGGSNITLNGTVTNDTGHTGVTWAIEFGSPLSLCSNPYVCGSLSNPTNAASGTSTNVSILYTPPTVPPSSPNNMVIIVATSKLDTTKDDVDSLTVTSAVSVTINNKFKNVPIGSSGVILNAAVYNDPKNQGVTWAIAGACAPNCGTLSNPGAAPSGAFTISSVVYTPPCPAPVANTGTITATSVLDGTKTDTDNFTITGGTYCISSANTGVSTEVNIAAPGTPGTANITVFGATGYNTATTLTCTVIPSTLTDPPTCAFPSGTSTSAAVTLGTPLLLSFKSTAVVASLPPHAPRNFPSSPNALLWIVAAIAVTFLLVLRLPQRRRGYAVLALLLFVTAGAAIACGGGGGSSGGGGGGGGGGNPNPGTTTGLYTVVVTGSPAGPQPVVVYFNLQ
jgi:subtilase family serine protease